MSPFVENIYWQLRIARYERERRRDARLPRAEEIRDAMTGRAFLVRLQKRRPIVEQSLHLARARSA